MKKPDWQIALLCTVFIGFSVCIDAAQEEATAGRVQVVLTKVMPHALQNNLDVYGVVAADPGRTINVNLTYDSVIEHVAVRVGQSIKRGQTLLQVKPAPAAHTAYVQAETARDVAHAALERNERLLSEHLATQADVEAARKALTDAQAIFAAQQAQPKSNADSQLRASTDAIVAQLSIVEGQQVAAGSMLLQLEPTLQRVAYLGIEPEVRRNIRLGQKVSVASVFNPQQSIATEVKAIQEAINPTTRLVDVVVAIPPQQAAEWLPGQQIKGRIILGEEKVLAVPRTALLEDEQGSYLYRVKADRAQKVYVTTGIEAQGYTEIAKGIQAGESVVISGNYELSDGMSVLEEKPLPQSAPPSNAQKQSAENIKR